MELKCFICEGRVDAEAETTFFFECHVYCDKCLEEMERSNGALWGRVAREELDVMYAHLVNP